MAGGASKPELRVLQVFHTLGVGGAELWLLALLDYYRRHAEELPVRLSIDICLTGGTPYLLDERVARAGARLTYLPYTRKTLPAFIRDYRGLLRSGRYHALHDHQDHSAGTRLLISIGLLPPVRAVHFHNPEIMRNAYRLGWSRRLTERVGDFAVRRLATHVLGTSRHVLDEHGFTPESLPRRTFRDAVYCGFDVGTFGGDTVADRASVCSEFGLAPDDIILLFVGRLNSNDDPALNQKNPSFAIDVAAAMAARGKRVRLLMAGRRDNVGAEFEDRLRARNLGDVVSVIGPRDDVARLMRASDALLLPSLGEGLGMVAVEAQAAGLRVLASDTTPEEASVVDGMVEFLPLSVGPEAWAARLERLLTKQVPAPPRANAVVAASRFTIERSALDLLAIYSCGLRTESGR